MVGCLSERKLGQVAANEGCIYKLRRTDLGLCMKVYAILFKVFGDLEKEDFPASL